MTSTVQATETDGSFEGLPDRDVTRLVRDASRELEVFHQTCLDVGSGTSRHDEWFQRFERAESPAEYVAVDTDRDIIERLRREGVDARHPDEIDGFTADLTLCLEVVEHIHEDGIPDFLRFVADHTNKIIAFTTPNLEYWTFNSITARPKPAGANQARCRWIPDHIPDLTDDVDEPHGHKQIYTPQKLESQLRSALTPEVWHLEVFRAWPWRIVDETRPEDSFVYYFKLFAIAWRTELSSAARADTA